MDTFDTITSQTKETKMKLVISTPSKMDQMEQPYFTIARTLLIMSIFTKTMSWSIQKKALMKDKIFVIILSVCTVCFCSCKNKKSDDFKCVYTDSIHQFEYYRNTNYIVIRVDSNILYFTPDNRLQQVCTRSSFRNQKLSLKGKVFYFNKKTGFLRFYKIQP